MTNAGPYDDIIELEHHVSATHPHMPQAQRAAQFMPFAALDGYERSIQNASDHARQHGPDTETYTSIVEAP